MYEITVVVVTYNSELEKILITIKSILLQKGVNYQIIIADDGSEKNYFEEIKRIFDVVKFKHYKFLSSKINRGTVHNVLAAVNISEGKYIKAISPGDILYYEYVLNDWIEDMEANHSDLSFANYVCYSFDIAGNMKTKKELAYPQCLKVYKRRNMEQIKRYYLLYSDMIVGAATLCKNRVLKKYLEMISDKVFYAEDNAFRLMLFDNVPVSFFSQNVILYEFGTGISTVNNSHWNTLLMRDWNVVSDMLIEKCSPKIRFENKLMYVLKTRTYGTNKEKMRLYLSITGLDLVMHKIKRMFFKRWTKIDLPEDFLKKIELNFDAH